MDFAPSATAQDLTGRLRRFLDEHGYPAEPVFAEQRRQLAASDHEHAPPPVLAELSQQARRLGLWNLFLPAVSGMCPPSTTPRWRRSRVAAQRSLRR